MRCEFLFPKTVRLVMGVSCASVLGIKWGGPLTQRNPVLRTYLNLDFGLEKATDAFM